MFQRSCVMKSLPPGCLTKTYGLQADYHALPRHTLGIVPLLGFVHFFASCRVISTFHEWHQWFVFPVDHGHHFAHSLRWYYHLDIKFSIWCSPDFMPNRNPLATCRCPKDWALPNPSQPGPLGSQPTRPKAKGVFVRFARPCKIFGWSLQDLLRFFWLTLAVSSGIFGWNMQYLLRLLVGICKIFLISCGRTLEHLLIFLVGNFKIF